jgi:hypothetical protein
MTIKTITSFLIATGLLAACSNNGNKSDNNTSGGGNELTGKTPAPAGVTFERKNFEGLGTIELPAGSGWEANGNAIYNEKLDMTVEIKSHASDDMSAMVDEYLESYDDVNKRDAPNWKRSSKQPGTINGMPGARVEGSFNNGTAYVVRDYLFFAPKKTVIIQCRITDTNKDKLQPLIDYIAGSFKK